MEHAHPYMARGLRGLLLEAGFVGAEVPRVNVDCHGTAEVTRCWAVITWLEDTVAGLETLLLLRSSGMASEGNAECAHDNVDLPAC
jgi:hypothetical protein